MMNPRDETAALQLAPAFVAKLRAASDALLTLNIAFCIVEGYRNAMTQDADYAKGRDAGGAVINRRQVVTNARAGQSMHQYGLAADCVPYLVGTSGQLNWTASSPQFQKMIAAMKAQDIVWGGDFKSIDDEDHFQMPGLPYTPTAAMQADFRSHLPLPQIWAKAAAGGYAT